MQGRLGPQGPVVLLTLPCPAVQMVGQWRAGAFGLHQPGRAVLTQTQVAALLRALDLPVCGQFTLRAQMPPGGGAGSSTAALVAIARLAGHPVAAARALALACIAVEGASDPLMFADPARILWASRQGRILRSLPPLPRIEVLGGFLGRCAGPTPPTAGLPITLTLPRLCPRRCAAPPPWPNWPAKARGVLWPCAPVPPTRPINWPAIRARPAMPLVIPARRAR